VAGYLVLMLRLSQHRFGFSEKFSSHTYAACGSSSKRRGKSRVSAAICRLVAAAGLAMFAGTASAQIDGLTPESQTAGSCANADSEGVLASFLYSIPNISSAPPLVHQLTIDSMGVGDRIYFQASVEDYGFDKPFAIPAAGAITLVISVEDGISTTELLNSTLNLVDAADENSPDIDMESFDYAPAETVSDVVFEFSAEFADGSSGNITIDAICEFDEPETPDEPSDDDDDTDKAELPAAVLRAYINERINRLIEDTPDRPRMVRKRLDALWGSASSGEGSAEFGLDQGAVPSDPGFGVSGMPGGNWRGHVSLRDMIHTGTYGVDIVTEPVPEAPTPPVMESYGCWDFWAEGHYTRFQDAGDRSGDFAVGYFGADCQVHSSAIVGFLGQFDWMNDEIGVVDSQTNGDGWMIGPYATIRLTQDLFLDFRAAWGRSSNEIELAGDKGSFDTSRWLIHGRLTGNYNYDDFRISPEIDLAYIEERQDAFVLSSGISIPDQDLRLGRLRFGPEIAWRRPLASGGFIEPHFSIKGLWDFDAENNITIAGIDYTLNEMRGIAEIGLLIQGANNINLRISGKYDGIGVSGYSAYGGTAWLNIPLY
jgi:hypothetical protein